MATRGERARRVERRRTAGRPARILVIDDDAGIRQMLSIVLAERGREAVVSDGHDLDAVGSDFDAVLLDVRLGDRTAREVLAATPSLDGLPIVLMTAASEDGDGLAGLPVGAILTKPFDLQALEDAIGAVVGTEG